MTGSSLKVLLCFLMVSSTCGSLSDLQPARNCADLLRSGMKANGVYKIDPDGRGPFYVFCDQTTDGGGWAVIQRRMDGSEDFSRVWTEYEVGFGNLRREYWLGLENIHRLTSQTRNELRVDLEDFSKKTAYAEYSYFAISDEHGFYKLSLGSYSGTAGDSLTPHTGMKFSTKDRDHDVHSSNCSTSYGGGAWWFAACYSSYLNGPYHHGETVTTQYLNWHQWKGSHASLKKAQMMIRPLLFK